MENLELESVPATAAKGLLAKAVRTLLAIAILGSVAAYAAISVEPQWVDYLSFIPEVTPEANQCSAKSCGSCSLEASVTACEGDHGCCSHEGEVCDPPSADISAEKPNSETTESVSAEDAVAEVGDSE